MLGLWVARTRKRGKCNATGMCTPAVRGLALKDHPMRAEACRMLADTEFTARNDKHLNAHRVQDLIRRMLPLCYRIIPTQAQPARSRLLRVLVFLFSYILLGLLSLVTRASLNQRALAQNRSGMNMGPPRVISTNGAWGLGNSADVLCLCRACAVGGAHLYCPTY